MIDNKAKGKEFTGIAVVYFCHNGQGQFVMQKRGQQARDEKGVWDIGAGALEFGETIEQALRKEIGEEYCATVLSFEFLGFRDTHREDGGMPTHWIDLDFKVLVDQETVKNGEPHKFDDVKWFTMDSLPPADQLHSQLPYFLEKYKGKL